MAVVRGSAVNQDGASNGLTAPSGPSQERVIRAALAAAGLETSDVDAVEAHGTGTTLGDPIEAQAVIATYGQGRSGGPLYLGSLKSNIGHSQAAAGVGGVIKMVQALRHEMLPATLWAQEPSPHVNWDAGAVRLLSEPVAWSAGERVRRAGVSSFGVSGTNAHVVLEEAPASDRAPAEDRAVSNVPSRVLPFVVSGSSENALVAQAARLREFVSHRPELDPAGVAGSLALGRAQLSHRAVAVAGSLDELADTLSGFERGEFVEGLIRGVARRDRRIAFVFPGQGGQWEGMALELLENSPVFAASMRDCADVLGRYVDWSLEDVLRGDPGQPSLDLIEVVQPVLFSIMVSLAALWRSYGVTPSAVVGHSQGEIAAAHVVGALSLEDAARVVVVRSQALASIAGQGGMMTVALSPDALAERVGGLDQRLGIAAINAPASLVVSGDLDALDTLQHSCEADGIPARKVASTVAGHSPQIEPLREQMLEQLASVTPHPSEIPLYSTVTAGRLDTSTMTAEHWFRNLRQTVRFEPAVRAMLEAGVNALIETGPHPVLAQSVLETAEAAGVDGQTLAVIGSLRRGDGGLERFIRSLAEAHVAGIEVDWSGLFGERAEGRVPLPTYAFQHRRYWLTAGTSHRDPSALGQAPAEHPLLDAMITLAGGKGTVFTGRLSLERHQWLADHVVMGRVLLPATAFLELALHAGARTGAEVVEQLTLAAPLLLENDRAVAIQLTVSDPDQDGRRHVEIHSRPDTGEESSEWTQHATATLTQRSPTSPEPPTTPPDDDTTEIDIDEFYGRLEQAGFEYGAAFQGVRRAWRRDGEIVAEVELDDAEAEQQDAFFLHPALLDAALQPAVLLSSEGPTDEPLAINSWSDVQLHGSGAAPTSARVRIENNGGVAAWATLNDGMGRPVASLRATLNAATGQQIATSGPATPRDSLLRLAWNETATPAPGSARYALVGDARTPVPDLEVHPDLGAIAAANDPAEPVVVVVADFRAADGDQPAGAAARSAVHRALDLIQAFLAEERLSASRLVFLTEAAVAAVDSDGIVDLAVAPVWGLVRSAQSEHPDRFVLVDVDGSDLSPVALRTAVASGEPQVAVRDGRVLVPRLARAQENGSAPDAERLAAGSVLITGGTGGVGAALARHVVTRYGVRHLLLTSRRGQHAPGAQDLVDELTALGAHVDIEACDLTDRGQVEALIRSVSADRPLTGVVHAAGATENSLVESMTVDQLDAVLAPKLDGALHLHELTQALDLEVFVLCSSMAATFGGPGQGNYAAANAFLDALAEHRRASGLAGLSIEWGIWEDVGKARTLTGSLDRVMRQVAGSSSFRPFSAEVGVDLFDHALATGLPMVLACPYRTDVIRDEVTAGTAPRLMSELVRARPRKLAAHRHDSVRQRRSGPDDDDRRRTIVDDTRAQIAGALGYESPDSLQMDLSFLELGFDSLVSLELRKRLQSLTGLTLPATIMYDHPSPAALVDHLQGLLNGTGGSAGPQLPAGSEAANGRPGAGTLTGMFRRAYQLGKFKDAVALAEAAARVGPRFGVSHIDNEAPDVIPLARGDAEPILFCIPSLVATGGPHEYARFAKSLQNKREVVAVPAPGFASDELLPSILAAAAGAQAAAIKTYAGGRRVALVGFSTGGLLAYAVARECAREGIAPTAVVLIDSYTMDTMWGIADPVFERMLAGDGPDSVVSDRTLTAMGAYLGMLSTWTPDEPVAPTLLVKATDPVPGLIRHGDWTASWSLRHAAVEVPGSHLTILEDHADTTVAVVDDWLVRQPRIIKRRRRLRSLSRAR